MRAPLFWLCWPLLLGLLLGITCPGRADVALTAAAACAALALVPGRAGPMALAAAALLLGSAAPALTPVGPELAGSASLRGLVLPLRGGGGQVVKIEALAPTGGAWAPAAGRVLVDFGEREPHPGQRAVFWGRPRSADRPRLPGSPDPLAVPRLAGAPSAFRAQRWEPLGGPTPRPAPPPCRHQALLAALALGERAALPAEQEALFRRTGTQHLLSISGMHLGLVGGLAGWLASRAARLRGLWAARSRPWWIGAPVMVAATLAYGGLAGWPASAWRAAAMLVAGGVGLALERGRDGRQAWGVAVFATVLIEPALVASAGWQLSAGALLGLLVVSPRLLRLLPPDLSPPLAWALRGIASTVAATLGTLPAAAWWFQDLAPTAVLANLAAIPLVGLVATPAALLATLLGGILAQAAAAVGCASLDLCLLWLRITQAPSWHPAVSPWGALVLVATPLLARRPSLAALAALAALGLRLAPTGRLTLTFLAVGQGDAALVRWPDGRSWLVDAGPEEREVLEWLRRAGLRSLDVVAATHPHPDHIGGLPAVLAEVPVAEFWVPRRAHPGEETFAALLDIASQRGVVVRDAGDPAVPALHPLPGWRSAPGDANEDSLALWLAYGQHRFLLAGDVEARAEAALVTRVGPVDLLKVPHHGSRTSSGAALLQALRPRLAVLSCGPGNTFGHPHPEVLARYAGTRLLRTDVDGTVEVVSDGLTLRVRTWRPGEGWRERGELDGYPWPSRASAAASALSWPSLESSRNR